MHLCAALRLIHRTSLAVLATIVPLAGGPNAVAKSPGADDFDWRATVRVQGPGPLHSVVLPAQAYQFARSPGLADLRLFNGTGESIPFAFAQVEVAGGGPSERQVMAVPLRLADTSPGALELPAVSLTYEGKRLTLNVQGQATGATQGATRTVAWYFDLITPSTSSSPSSSQSSLPSPATELSPPATPPYRALTLRIADGADFQTAVTLEGSDDLRQWRMLARHAPLLRVGRDAQAIRHDRIEFAPTRLRYLRLTWPSALSSLAVEAAAVEDEPKAGSPDWQTLRLAGKARSEGGETVVSYVSPTPLPVDRVQLILPQVNTIAPARIESRRSESDPWTARQSATFYRLASNPAGATDATSAAQPIRPMPVDDRFWQVKFDRRAGDFGAQPPELELIWPAQRVVFAARGNPPFTLAIGRPRLSAAALPIATIVPGYRQDQPLAASPAQLDAAQSRTGERGWLDDVDPTQAAMWAALVVAVAVLGGLAWRMVRSPGAH